MPADPVSLADTGGFTPETFVLTPDGAVPLSALEPGDAVIGVDPATALIGAHAVLTVVAGTSPELVDLAVAGRFVTCGPAQMFWSPGRGRLPARALRRGTPLASVDGSTPPVAHHSLRGPGAWPILRPSVAGPGTYFVSAAGILAGSTLPAG